MNQHERGDGVGEEGIIVVGVAVTGSVAAGVVTAGAGAVHIAGPRIPRAVRTGDAQTVIAFRKSKARQGARKRVGTAIVTRFTIGRAHFGVAISQNMVSLSASESQTAYCKPAMLLSLSCTARFVGKSKEDCGVRK